MDGKGDSCEILEGKIINKNARQMRVNINQQSCTSASHLIRTSGDGRLDQSVKLLVSADGELQMARCDTVRVERKLVMATKDSPESFAPEETMPA